MLNGFFNFNRSMKTIKELKEYENKLAQAALDYLDAQGGDAQTHHVIDYMAIYLEELIGKKEYRSNEVNCIGVIDVILCGLKSDGLVNTHGARTEITRKGRFVEDMRYSAFAVAKKLSVFSWLITGVSKVFKSFWWFVSTIFTLASILAFLLLRE